MFKYMLLALLMVSTTAFAKDACGINTYIKSPEGQEKLIQMLDRTKSLIVSKLMDLDIKESDIEIKAALPKDLKDKATRVLKVSLKANDLLAIWGEDISLVEVEKKVKVDNEKSTDDVCGLEITFNGGNLQNRKTGQDFGSLGKVKEFIRLN